MRGNVLPQETDSQGEISYLTPLEVVKEKEPARLERSYLISPSWSGVRQDAVAQATTHARVTAKSRRTRIPTHKETSLAN